MAVVPGKICGRQVSRDAPGFFRGRIGVTENISNKVDEI
jgi:hypothetical protein